MNENTIPVFVKYWDQVNAKEYFTTIYLPDIGFTPYPAWRLGEGQNGETTSNKYNITAIEFNGTYNNPSVENSTTGMRLLALYDQHTKKVIAYRALDADERLLRSIDGDQRYQTVTKINDSTWLLKTFDFGPNVYSNANIFTAIESLTFNVPLNFRDRTEIENISENHTQYRILSSHIEHYIEPIGLTPGFMVVRSQNYVNGNYTNEYTIQQFTKNSNGTINLIKQIPINLTPPEGKVLDWIGHSYILNNDIYINASFINIGTNWSDGWEEYKYKINFNNTPQTWTSFDEDQFWKLLDVYTQGNTVLRYGEQFIDLKAIGLIKSGEAINNDGLFPFEIIPNTSKLFLSLEVETTSHPVGFERWAIYDLLTKQISTSKDFNLQNGGVQTKIITDLDLDPHYVYFQILNLTFPSFTINNLQFIQNFNSNSLYRIPINQIESILKTASATITAMPGVELIQNFNTLQLTGRQLDPSNEVLFLAKYIPANLLNSWDKGSILTYAIWNRITDEDTYYIGKLDQSGKLLSKFKINREISDAIVNKETGHIYFLTNYDYDNNLDRLAFLYDSAKGVAVEIGIDQYAQVKSMEIPHLGWYISQMQEGANKVAAIQVDKGLPIKELQIIDLASGVKLYTNILSINDHLVKSVTSSNEYYIVSANTTGIGQWTINNYSLNRGDDYSLSLSTPISIINGPSVNYPTDWIEFFVPPSFSDNVTANNGIGYFSINRMENNQPSGSELYSYSASTNSATLISKSSADFPDNYLFSNYGEHSLGVAFIVDGNLWLQVNPYLQSFEQNFESYQYVMYSPDAEIGEKWSSLSQAQFWSQYDSITSSNNLSFSSVNQDSLKQLFGYTIFDDIYIDVDDEFGVTVLPSGNLLIRAEIERESSNGTTISYEHWAIVDSNGVSLGDLAFSSDNGLKQRSVVSIDDQSAIYFQNINLTFNKSGTTITSVSQPTSGTATSLYKIPLDKVEGVLLSAISANNVQNLVGRSDVVFLANFSQNQLTGTLATGSFAALGAVWQANSFNIGDPSYIVAGLRFSNFSDENPQIVLSKVLPSNQNPLGRRLIDGEIDDIIQDFSNGIIFIKTEINENPLNNKFYAFDVASAFIVEIPSSTYNSVYAANGVPQNLQFVFGTGGNDLSLGSATTLKDQRIYAGNGDDTMRSGLGDNVFFGGAGSDRVIYSESFNNYHIARSIIDYDKFIAVGYNINNSVHPDDPNRLPKSLITDRDFLVARSIANPNQLVLVRFNSYEDLNTTLYSDFYIPQKVDAYFDVEQLIFNDATVHIYNRSETGLRIINGSTLNRDVVLINGQPNDISFTKINETTIEIRFIGAGTNNVLRINNNINSLMFSELSKSYQLEIPWSTNLTQKQLDDYFLSYADNAFSVSTLSPNIITNSPSNFSDFIDHYISLPVTSSVDASGGNDFIFTNQTSQNLLFNTVRGGAGDDYIYVGKVLGQFNVFGDIGNDIITVDRSSLASTAFLSIDGGAGNDTYRIALNSVSSIGSRIHIDNPVGINNLILAVNNNSTREGPAFSEGLSYFWEANQLRITDQFGSTALTASLNSIRNLTFTYDGRYFNNQFFSGNLVNPVVLNFTNGQLTGTAGSDILLPIAGVRLNYNGGAGDDLIIMNAVSGGVVQGGLGNDIILVDDPNAINPRHTLSYSWTAAGAISEINLKLGFSYTINPQGVPQGTDRFEGKYFDGVIGGAGNETIYGNHLANVIDGGAGNDIIYSGRNVAGEGRNILIGGAGNDILIEQTVWQQASPASLFSGSLMQGGAGDDIYVLMTGGAPATSLGQRFTPTKIVERNPNNTNAGGNDTIRLLEKGGDGIGLYSFSQVGNTVRVDLGSDEHDFGNLKVGDTVLLGFLNGRTSSNGYTVNRVIKDPDTLAVVGFEVTSPIVAAQSGSVFVSEFEWSGSIGYWADNDYFAHFSYKASEGALNNVFDGQNILTYYDGDQVSTPLQLIALVDRHAMDFVEVGGVDPLGVGMRMPISFNQGRSNDLEVIVAGSNGNAVLFGGNGTDIIHDTPYNDILIGGAGHDLMVSYFGFDIMIGGDGNDFLRFRSDGQILVGGSGADHFQVAGIGNRAALITDFKSWEGDRVSLDHDWLTKNRSFNVDEENSLLVRTQGDTASFYLNSTKGQEHFLDVIFNQESDYQTIADQLAAQLPGSWEYWHQA